MKEKTHFQDKRSPFSDNPFMMGYESNIFEADEELGFRFPEGKIISGKGFVDLSEKLRGLKQKKIIIHNMGDSSTSGWNSEKVTKKNKNAFAPFFTYKTYSDLIEEQSDLFVINAGVPGYSSLQGKLYLQRLLAFFEQKKIQAEYVTAYFGNNDGTYNKYGDSVRVVSKKINLKSSVRVSIQEFKKNISDMIDLSQKHGAKIILFMPLVRYDWPPGLRSQKRRREFKKSFKKLTNSFVKIKLIRAISFFKKKMYEKALEEDKVLPRLKKRYVLSLKQIADEKNILLIDVQNEITLHKSKQYFADYCHPIEKANQLLVDRFFSLLHIQKKKKEIIPLQFRLFKAISCIPFPKRKEEEISANNYTLY